MLCCISPDLTLTEALCFISVKIEGAYKLKADGNYASAIILCNEIDSQLSRLSRKATKDLNSSSSSVDQSFCGEIAGAYKKNGKLWDELERHDRAEACYSKAKKWKCFYESGNNNQESHIRAFDLVNTLIRRQRQAPVGIAKIPSEIFPCNETEHVLDYPLPEPDDRLQDTNHLVYCLLLLPNPSISDNDRHRILNEKQLNWSHDTVDNQEEMDRLNGLAKGLVDAYINNELKDEAAIAEVTLLAPVLNCELFKKLFMTFFSAFSDESTLLDVSMLKGLSCMVQGAPPGHLESDDLKKVLNALTKFLNRVCKDSSWYVYSLTLAVSHVLDAMADNHVKGLKDEDMQSLLLALKSLNKHPDPYVVFQAEYAVQALRFVPSDKTPLQAVLKGSGILLGGVVKLAIAVNGIDIEGIIDGLTKVHAGLSGAYDACMKGYEGVKELMASGEEFLSCLTEASSVVGSIAGQKYTWYTALHCLSAVIQQGHFADFRNIVCKAPFRRHPAFQWGVCHLLGEIASNCSCHISIRKGSIDFLSELYRNDDDWGKQPTIKQWILSIINSLVNSDKGIIKAHAKLVLRILGNDNDAYKKALYDASMNNGKKSLQSYPLIIGQQPSASPSLLSLVQNTPDIEKDIRRLRKQRLKQLEQNNVGTIYITQQAKSTITARDDALFPLMDKVKEFLEKKQKVFLLLGESGAGKSIFSRALELMLWEKYEKDRIIPLFINLPTIDKPEHNLVAKHLRKAEFSESQIREMKERRTFVLICDGYDESHQTQNLYVKNHLNQQGEFQAQMVISCRLEYINNDYLDLFQPMDRNHMTGGNGSATQIEYQQAVIAPFNKEQVDGYVEKFVTKTRPVWQTSKYISVLNKIPNLLDLVKNPFLLALSLEILPRLDHQDDFSHVQATRIALYDQFMEQWFERGKKRLAEMEMGDQEKKAYERLTDDGFMQNGVNFLKDLARAIYKNQAGNPVVEYSHSRDYNTWKGAFFGHEDEKQLLLKASPIRRFGNHYRFIHRSMLEYAFAHAVFEPLESKKSSPPKPTTGRRGSSSSTYSFECQIKQENEVISTQLSAHDHPLSWKNFVSEPSIINFLAEHVQQDRLFKQHLRDIIELSKSNIDWRIAAANAITILVKAGIQFNGADLQGIRIPGADLSYGLFDSADLRNADLRRVNFRNVWMRGANLSKSRMSSARFGELPLLQIESKVTVCMYAPDGSTFAVGTDGYKVCVFETLNWHKMQTLRGHKNPISSIAYSRQSDVIASSSKDSIILVWDVSSGICLHKIQSGNDVICNIEFSPNGNQIASVSHGKKLQLWDVKLGECLFSLTGYTMTYSPNGELIAFGSTDNTVQLWDIKNGKCTQCFTGHTKEIVTIAFSPDGNQIASGSNDKTVRFWDVRNTETKEFLLASRHDRAVISVVYSKNGDQVASSSFDNTVRLWDTKTRLCLLTLTGHSRPVKSIAYSPKEDGNQIASGSEDNTVRLWDTVSGSCLRTLTGHSGSVVSIMFSPSGNQIASGSSDKTVRLWDVEPGVGHYTSSNNISSSHISSSHRGGVNCVAYLPVSSRIASGSDDGTIQLWSLETGVCSHTLVGHSDKVLGIACSPNGERIASCSLDETVRLWDVKTGECINILRGLREAVHCIAFSPQKRLKQLDSLNLENSQCSSDSPGSPSLSGPDSTSSPNSQDPDSSGYYWVAFGGTNKTIGEWDLNTTDYEQFPVKHNQLIKALAYSSCGAMIATGSFDMNILLWDVSTKSCLRTLTGHHNVINSIAYSPDDKQLATGSNDLTVRIWNIETGECINILQHKKPVSSVVYSPKRLPKKVTIGLTKDSPENLLECLPKVFQIATASSTTIQIWDSASGECQAEFQNYGSALDISWSETHKGDFLVTGGDDKLIRSWELKKTQDSQQKIYLAWCSTPHELTFTSADIHKTEGLSELSEQLLMQQGATRLTLKNTTKEVMQAHSTISGFTHMAKKDIPRRLHETEGTPDRLQEA